MISIPIFVILLILVFPIFLIVFKTNRNRDKETAVYPIINHFFKATCVFYVFFFLTIAFSVYKYFTAYDFHKEIAFHYLTTVSPWVAVFLIAWVLIVIYVQIHHFILSLLAIQRFVLFFFPGSDSYINLKEIVIKILIYLIYALFYIGHVSIAYIWSGRTEMQVQASRVYPWYYLSLNCLLFICAIMYIPIVISIKKLEHLSSAVQNKPHKYILYQTLWIVLFKIAHIFAFLFNYMTAAPLFNYFFGFFLLDVLTTPLIIQLSYIMCNKRNSDTWRKWLSWKYLYTRLFKCSEVKPHSEPQTDGSTVAT